VGQENITFSAGTPRLNLYITKEIYTKNKVTFGNNGAKHVNSHMSFKSTIYPLSSISYVYPNIKHFFLYWAK